MELLRKIGVLAICLFFFVTLIAYVLERSERRKR